MIRRDSGSVSAELALALPAVLLVLSLGLGAAQLGSVRLRAQAAAGDAARSLARGDPPGRASAIAAALSPDARVSRHDRGGMVCVRVTVAGAARGPLAGIVVAGTSCALGGAADGADG